MENVKEIRSGRHCVFMMHVHLVFVTKYRRGTFTKDILDDLKLIFGNRSRVCAEKGRVTPPPSIAESLFVFKEHFD